jgi:SAM-dependent methyltransferase
LTTTPVENVVWGAGAEGAGTFVNCYKRYFRAKSYCQQPFDKFKTTQGKVRTLISEDEQIAGQFVTSFQELQETPKGTMLFCQDSSNLPAIPDQSVDFVITDPPYFDSIHYSELSNFFYVWLRELANDPHFEMEHVPTRDEAIGNSAMEKGESEYQHLMTAVFRECHRVLKKDGKLIFTFHHKKWQVWWTILQSLVKSGFRVADSFPVNSEYKVNPHIRNKQSLDMDLVLICQPITAKDPHFSTVPQVMLQHALENRPADGNANRLFLSFMGELLKAASSPAEEGNSVSYQWFANALAHFDDYQQRLTLPTNSPIYQTTATQLAFLREGND